MEHRRLFGRLTFSLSSCCFCFVLLIFNIYGISYFLPGNYGVYEFDINMNVVYGK